jgi:glycosyltransferase involved in cell wall biosynthesis
MRILLTSNASYAPPRGGSTRSNLAWLSELVRHGHTCRVVCAALDQNNECINGGIEIHSVRNLVQHRDVLAHAIRGFDPDVVLVSSEDLSHMLLREAAAASPAKIVYLAHTPQFFPFGPESWNRDTRGTEIVRGARAVVAIGQTIAAYIEQAIGVRPSIIHPPIYGPASFARHGSFGSGPILMVNPCQVKGIGIFLDLARRFPEFPFTALAGWGTSKADRTSLATLSNIELVESVNDIEEILSKTRILLMPSLWYEGFGLAAMEAMLRGIPVVSSDAGGLAEARDGSGFVIPVRRIERYLPEFDDTGMPRPLIPEQDLTPWMDSLQILLHDRGVYQAESERCRSAGVRFVSALDRSAFEKLLLSLAAAEN